MTNSKVKTALQSKVLHDHAAGLAVLAVRLALVGPAGAAATAAAAGAVVGVAPSPALNHDTVPAAQVVTLLPSGVQLAVAVFAALRAHERFLAEVIIAQQRPEALVQNRVHHRARRGLPGVQEGGRAVFSHADQQLLVLLRRAKGRQPLDVAVLSIALAKRVELGVHSSLEGGY